jgi:integrase
LAIGHRVTDDGFVFSDDAGEPLWGRHVTTREFGPLLRQAELPPIRFHDLRHTFATLQLTAGTNPKIVSEVLGHKDVAITLDRYSHAMPTMQVEAMGRLDAILGRSAPETLNEASGPAPLEPALWLDQESGAASSRPLNRYKGPGKGPK